MALKGTANQTGFEMAQTSPVFDQWIASYDGLHPLLDIGCAYGLNVAAAAERLRSEAEVKVVACDCAEEHLRAVDELKIAGVKTIFGRLPDGLEALQKIALECGGFSGILVSEVLHFLPGEGIELAIRQMQSLLAPHGRLCLTMFSPESNISGQDCPFGQHMRETYLQRESEGWQWPGEGFNVKGLLQDFDAPVTKDEEKMQCFPSYFHVARPAQLAAVLEKTGFQVLVAEAGRHPGHAAHFWYEGKESTQVVAQKAAIAGA